MTKIDTGIASIGLHLPPLAMPVEELASLRGVDPDKYRIGLGCSEISLCPPEFSIVDLASEAARRALSRWDGGLEDIGMIAVGTETAVDMSRPLSAFVADELGLVGNIRSYEVKHACYGGTLALRQACEWRMSGAAREKAALVVAADIALYEQGDPGEPTQGAGAVAFVVDQPEIAQVGLDTHAWSEPAFDFYRPVGESYPTVDGKLSLECYKKAAVECFNALADGRNPAEVMERFSAICFHVPFPKMVKKAFHLVGEVAGWSAERIQQIYSDKVEPSMLWNRLSGNSYTASLWIAVANALQGLKTGEQVAAFSYGSGFGSEILSLVAGPRARDAAWAQDIERDVSSRRQVDASGYSLLRAAVRTAAA